MPFDPRNVGSDQLKFAEAARQGHREKRGAGGAATGFAAFEAHIRHCIQVLGDPAGSDGLAQHRVVRTEFQRNYRADGITAR